MLPAAVVGCSWPEANESGVGGLGGKDDTPFFQSYHLLDTRLRTTFEETPSTGKYRAWLGGL